MDLVILYNHTSAYNMGLFQVVWHIIRESVDSLCRDVMDTVTRHSMAVTPWQREASKNRPRTKLHRIAPNF